MKSRIVALALLAMPLLACGDPLRPQASIPTQDATLTVYALTETPVALPTAINLFFQRAVRAEPANAYDVVFDIIDGQPTLLPPSAIGAFGRAGLQKVEGTFEALTAAPRTGYDETEPLPVSEGDLVVVRATASQFCFGGITPYIYGKLLITAIHPVDRGFTVRMRVNPNCGFRSFADGIPTF